MGDRRYAVLDPVDAVLAAGGGDELIRRTSIDPLLLRRAVEHGGFTIEGADRVATALGVHPASIWRGWVAVLELDDEHRRSSRQWRYRADRDTADHLDDVAARRVGADARRRYLQQQGAM